MLNNYVLIILVPIVEIAHRFHVILCNFWCLKSFKFILGDEFLLDHDNLLGMSDQGLLFLLSQIFFQYFKLLDWFYFNIWDAKGAETNQISFYVLDPAIVKLYFIWSLAS